jgi:hypothetical protein
MLNKDPTKRLKLIEFVDFPYALWEEEELEERINKVIEKYEESKIKAAEEEEQKLQEKFLM